jgi:hypothetical protein
MNGSDTDSGPAWSDPGDRAPSTIHLAIDPRCATSFNFFYKSNLARQIKRRRRRDGVDFKLCPTSALCDRGASAFESILRLARRTMHKISTRHAVCMMYDALSGPRRERLALARHEQGEHFWLQTGRQVSPRRQEPGGKHSSRQHILTAGGGTTTSGCGIVGIGEN